MKVKITLFLIVLALLLSACGDAWESHRKNDYWPATSNPVSQGFDKLVCLDPQSKMPQCK